ncbi:MAG: ROK family protein, partial [Candidatus Omnitrophica bacterium]|nr:ROK family protein [Candidatus Omnitrophota bacterium]
TSTNFGSIGLRNVFSAARLKNTLALSVLDAAAKRLGIKTAFIVNLLNPQAVIIGGGLEEAGERFMAKLNSTVKEWAFREAVADLKISYSRLKENAVACGAADLVIEKIFAGLL